MPVFGLGEQLIFPPAHLANPDGILAVGGDLQAERLLLAYENGIFPWYDEEDPIIWWAPDPRFVLFPADLKVSKSMRQVLRRETFRMSFDQDFPAVIRQCQKTPRPGQRGTWITDAMQQAYIDLHEMGFAHSVEVWQDELLVGGLYGVSLGNSFFGESMFAHVSNASKAGFITLVRRLEQEGFQLIDCQVYTKHLESLGAKEIPREQFMRQLAESLNNPAHSGNWGTWLSTDPIW
ncbi:MAG: leucyl/phenylalanyl-tRNA--protein transferase [Bacteroidota bacterium]